MLSKLSTQNGDFYKDRRKGERRKMLRRSEDKMRGEAYRRKNVLIAKPATIV